VWQFGRALPIKVTRESLGGGMRIAQASARLHPFRLQPKPNHNSPVVVPGWS